MLTEKKPIASRIMSATGWAMLAAIASATYLYSDVDKLSILASEFANRGSVVQAQRDEARDLLNKACVIMPNGKPAITAVLRYNGTEPNIPQVMHSPTAGRKMIYGTIPVIDGRTVKQFNASALKFVDCEQSKN